MGCRPTVRFFFFFLKNILDERCRINAKPSDEVTPTLRDTRIIYSHLDFNERKKVCEYSNLNAGT